MGNRIPKDYFNWVKKAQEAINDPSTYLSELKE